jgi:signal transduction histidine kinase/streptogramin lyase
MQETPMDLGLMPLPKSDMIVTTMYEDRKGAVWIGTYGGGVLRFKDGQFTSFNTKNGLSHDVVLSIYEDEDGNLWVGTNGGGVNRLRERIFTTYDMRHGLSDNVILSLCAGHDGAVWIGTDAAGLNRYKDGACEVFARRERLRNESVWALHEDKNKNLWIGTWGGGIYRYDGRNYVHFGSKDGLSSHYVRAIYEDRHGVLWFGTYDGGLNRFENGKFTVLSTRDGLAHNDVRAIYEDSEGTLWVGTGGGGISCWRGGKFHTFTRTNGLPSNFVRTFFEDKSGVLWIGTPGGLCRHQEGKFSSITRHEGLHDNMISQIFEDDAGNFWMGSNRGIFRARRSDLEAVAAGENRWLNCTSYDRGDGLGSAECSGGFQPPGCKTRDGRLWFPTTRGVSVVDPKNLKVNRKPPKVIIEELLVEGLKVSIGSPVRISAGRKHFEFRYTGLSFDAPRRIKFKYKLDGLDEEWSAADTKRLAYYSYVPPGQYVFKVMAANNDGFWNELGAVLPITVLPPFWKTWWFLTAVGLVLLAGLAAAVRYFSWQALQRKIVRLEQERAVEAERARISKDMHDSIGGSLTQIGLLGEIARRHAHHPSTIEVYADKISAAARDVAQTLDEIVWAANPERDTLEELISYLVHYAEDFFEVTRIRCHFDVPPEIPRLELPVEARHNIFLVAKEAFNNVAKYSKASEVQLVFAFAGKTMEMKIRDTGKGFSPETVVPGNGLGNMRRRVEKIGGQFDLRSEVNRGTEISVRIKLPA